MIAMSKNDLFGALSEAIDVARGDGERSTEEIIETVAERFTDTDLSTWAATAKFHLEGASRLAATLEEHEAVPLIGALLGIGCALMAISENAEVFYAMMGDHRKAAIG